jgi:hypothetical protein
MFKTTIVVWLVLLVLALTVVAFVTRIIEECRLPRDLSTLRKNRPCRTNQSTGDIETSTEPADTPVGIVCFTRSDIVASTSKTCETERLLSD